MSLSILLTTFEKIKSRCAAEQLTGLTGECQLLVTVRIAVVVIRTRQIIRIT